ncbi:hypothetical protein AVEN_249529-1 [Araneus ventricosus]|uniref:Uncharacterized protein n=1 Tax=Araneus ventricosus TaxID=182803 RepID=A0A4Y2UJ78_ARAVE|nr:hypothetical protein AVEN_249529-1 [Araneus ventricosus]
MISSLKFDIKTIQPMTAKQYVKYLWCLEELEPPPQSNKGLVLLQTPEGWCQRLLCLEGLARLSVSQAIVLVLRERAFDIYQYIYWTTDQ